MKVSIPIGAACTLSDLKVWVEEVNPEVIAIPKGHTLTHIREFNPWDYQKEDVWTRFKGIPIFYVETGEVEYVGIPIVRNNKK